MILTEKQIIEAFESIQPCPVSGPTCDTCTNAITIGNSDYFTVLMITMVYKPSLITIFGAKMIEVGMAVAEQKKMEEMFR